MASHDQLPDLERFKVVENSVILSIINFFGLPEPSKDTYQYAQESSSVTLQQAQSALESGTTKYHYFHGSTVVQIKDADIDAYIGIFKSSTDTAKALASFESNAKKDSPRMSSARYLALRRILPPTLQLTKKKSHENPYFELWALCCHDLGFLGPLDTPSYSDPAASRQSHPILPVFMHHFGCAIPSYEALGCINHVAQGRTVLDVGCGNGYWSALLRRAAVAVVPVDDCSSTWRTGWVSDTVRADAVEFLRARDSSDEVLLLVYPITGHGLTGRILARYHGDTVVIVGTQNRNRYTAFPDQTVDEHFALQPDWQVVVRLPIPSFPGKDDALYVIQKQSRDR
ncbi:Putative uncharacterized protein [Taphrina deformans PYCC 5710]|uniref:Methyltransferase domain-containing protein n=1 Tax=Taphrina deformans (strain PYCC 5710 / ATCC 11124 / CBS 356.35 / IMI 108563 / JCM 9778 / NBRC 8474) TaxID=1097556 RepID=R4XC57_TAPDE|nr:Putative uncharacterized protein [Taphrina deformans PYCC 5710]|eukprot:CCG80920.1 Putative uncharacterized protein [Taphrina deformans PYCC 5710]